MVGIVCSGDNEANGQTTKRSECDEVMIQSTPF